MDKKMYVKPSEDDITSFAERHLSPFTVKGGELVAKICPFCNGGDSGDTETFYVSLSTGQYCCHRGKCGVRGGWMSLLRRFGEAGNIKSVSKGLKILDLKPLPRTAAIDEYFAGRSISPATLDAYQISATPEGNIMFPFYLEGELIYAKYRQPTTQSVRRKEWAQAGAKPILFGMDLCDPSLPLVITEGQCFPGDAEILTPSGWKRFDQYDGSEMVMSVDDKMHGHWELPHAIVRKEYHGDLFAYRVKGNFTSITTPDHNMVLMNARGEIRKRPVNTIVTGTSFSRIPTAIKLEGNGIPLSDDEISLYIAVSADCSISRVRKNGYRHARFAVKKKRKYDRMKGILDRLSIEYHDSGLLKSGYYYIGFRIPNFVESKKFPFSWVIDATLHQREHILFEQRFWDGNSVVNREQYEYSTIIYDNAVVMQALAHTSGHMSTIMERDNKYTYKGEVRKGHVYKVSILLKKSYVTIQRPKFEHVPYDGMVYCVSVSTGMILVRQERHIMVTGNCDTLALHEAGIPNTVSVPSGCDNFDWVENIWDWLENFQKIIIFGDNDAPGQKMVRTLANRLGEDRVWIVDDYPDGCKDANDILTTLGREVLLQTFNSAKEVPIQGLIDLADVEDVDPTTVPRIKTGIPALDSAINGLEAGGITVIFGNPGHGKSTLSGTILLSAIEQGHKVCAVSMELTAQKFREWINLQCAGSQWITTKWDNVRGHEVPVVYPPAVQRIEDWYRGKFFLYESSEMMDGSIADSVLSVFTMAAKRKGCDLFLVDNLMTVLMDAGDDEYRAQGVFMAKVKRFAVRYNAHVIIIAHPRKNKGFETLTPDDVAGSKYIVNLASNALSIEKPDIRIQKSRDSGILKLIECCYCGDSRRVYQADVGDKYVFSWDRTGLTPPTKLACSLPEYGIFRSNNTQMF